MWPFKERNTTKLAPISSSKGVDEITLLPEDGIPDELPTLQESAPIQSIQIPISIDMPKREEPVKRPQIMPAEKFLKMDKYKGILLGINDVNSEFDNIDSEISKVIDLKDSRNTKIDSIQDNLEDVGKKLMFIENSLFGGENGRRKIDIHQS